MKGKGAKGKRIFQVEAARARLLKTIKWKQVHAPQYEPESFAEFRKVKPSYVYQDNVVKTVVVIEKTGRFWSNADPEHFSDTDWALNFAYSIEKVSFIICFVTYRPSNAVVGGGEAAANASGGWRD